MPAMDDARLLVFANPAACGGLTEVRRAMLERLTSRTGGTLLGPDTTSAEAFADLITSCTRDGDRVVFAGGDGTLHDGLNAIHERDVTVGYIPFGTGNAAAFAFDMMQPGPLGAFSPPDEAALVRLLTEGAVKTIDLVRVDADCLSKPQVALFTSVGWCAKMAGNRQGRGLVGYVMPALRNVVGEYYTQDVRVSVDARTVWQRPSTFVVVTKSKYYGAGVTVAPGAKLDDGLLHSVVYELSRAEMTGLYLTSFLGKRPKANRTARGYQVRLHSTTGPVPLQIDGDYAGVTERVLCQVVGRAIRVLTGRP